MFSFAITPLGDLFFILQLFVFGSLVFLINVKRELPLYTILFLSFMMIFYADNFITLFIGWEIMGWSSFFLIAKNARVQTLQKYIAFNIAGAFAFLGAIILIYSFCGSFAYGAVDLSNIPQGFLLLIASLFMITIFIKSGIVPFHFWIVDSYNESNHIFTTFLSALISKAGIFLFLLVFYKLSFFQFSSEKYFFTLVAWLGVITSIIATFKAIWQDEIKKLLAYSSIAQISYIITVLAIVSDSAVGAALYHTIIHLFVKLLLFMNIAGLIVISSRERFEDFGALLYKYPIAFILLVIGIIVLAGMPPLGGFSSKFLIYTTLLEQKKGLLLAAVMFSSAASFLYCYKLVYGIYLGSPTKTSLEITKPIPKRFYIPQIISAIILIILGIFPGIVIPYFNTILNDMGYSNLAYTDIFTLQSSFGAFNGGVVMAVFAVLFLLILFLVTRLKNKVIAVRDPHEISYCGEVPKEQVNLHYGYGMAKEIRKIGFIKVILYNSSRKLWENTAKFFYDASDILRSLYSISVQNSVLIMVTVFAVLLAYGVL